MTTTVKPMPKSLHTITALMNVAKLIGTPTADNAADLIEQAAAALGYETAEDPHGLKAKAAAQLGKAA